MTAPTREELLALTTLRPRDKWHEDMGDVLWWYVKDGVVQEAPWVGTPLCCGRTVEAHTTTRLITQLDQGHDPEPVIHRIDVGGWPGYHTHFSVLPTPASGEAIAARDPAVAKTEAKPLAWQWCNGRWAERNVIAEPAVAVRPLAALVDEIAQWLHDETDHPEAYAGYMWPETERDDGQREGGCVKIVPYHAQAYFRDIASRLVAKLGAQLYAAPPSGEVERLRIVLREARDAVEFFDKVKGATEAEKIAVGTDHWDRLEAAIRACAALSDGEVR